jgi:fatty acid desaturase
MLFCFVWFCLVLFGFVWFCLVLFGFVWFCLVLFGFVWFVLIWFDNKPCELTHIKRQRVPVLDRMICRLRMNKGSRPTSTITNDGVAAWVRRSSLARL